MEDTNNSTDSESKKTPCNDSNKTMAPPQTDDQLNYITNPENDLVSPPSWSLESTSSSVKSTSKVDVLAAEIGTNSSEEDDDDDDDEEALGGSPIDTDAYMIGHMASAAAAASANNDNNHPNNTQTVAPVVARAARTTISATGAAVTTATASSILSETVTHKILPGIGKILAMPSSLHACDVDAFVDRDFNISDDDASSAGSPYPLYRSARQRHEDRKVALKQQQQQQQQQDSIGDDVMSSPATISTFDDDDDDDIEQQGHSHNKTTIHKRHSTTESKRSGTALDPHTDPFAARVGKTLVWRNVNMTLKMKQGQPDRQLLHNLWGEVPKTETTAIMGASGAGKTSLLNILAGRARTGGRLTIDTDVRLNNYAVDPSDMKSRQSNAFVAQDDSLQATATPREAIRFSAKLRLPRSTTEDQLDELAERMIHELGLSACADTIVGGPLIKGISGGERKRASVGVELVVKPAMVFLDEPTSGLDSFSAVQVCQVLKKVANAGASVLFTIHQPSSEIFSSFDHLILLHKGRVLYQGAVSKVPSFFASCGYPCPTNYNPADWVVNVAQKYPIPELEESGFFPDDVREYVEPSVARKGEDALGMPIRSSWRNDDISSKPPPVMTQVKMLFQREFTYMYRFPDPQYARFGLTAFLSALIGMIFWNIGESSASDILNLNSQFGAIMLLQLLAMLGTAQPALLFFPEERPIFLREYSTDHYSVMSYFISRLVVEMVNTGVQVLIMVAVIYYMAALRGSVFVYLASTYALAMSGTAMAVFLGVSSGGNAKVAQQLLPLIFIPQLMFAGFFISTDLIPHFLRWVQYICVLTYSIRMVVIEHFNNCSDNYFENENCKLVMNTTGADVNDIGLYWTVLVVYFFVCRLGALALLRKSARKFY